MMDKRLRQRVLVSALAALIASCRFESSPLASRVRTPLPAAPELLGGGVSAAPSIDSFGNAPPQPMAPPPAPAAPAVFDLAMSGNDAGYVADSGAIGAPDAGGPSMIDAGADAQPEDLADAATLRPELDALFTPCYGDADCDSGLLCTTRSVQGVPATSGYCTTVCDLSVSGSCPQPIDGMVIAACTEGLCILQSCERAQCPDYMTCVRTYAPGVTGPVFECAPDRGGR